MLYRNKKKNDLNIGKYIGIGGKFEEGESPFDCVIRETREECGLSLLAPDYRGIITFVSDCYPTEQMHLFTTNKFSGEIRSCNEGELLWVPKKEINQLPLWEGDRIFLRLLDEDIPFFSLKLIYRKDDLLSAVLNGQALDVNEGK